MAQVGLIRIGFVDAGNRRSGRFTAGRILPIRHTITEARPAWQPAISRGPGGPLTSNEFPRLYGADRILRRGDQLIVAAAVPLPAS